MMADPRALLAAALLAAPSAAGCAGGEAPTPAEYRREANAICATARADTAPLVTRLTEMASSINTRNAPQAATVAERLETVARRHVQRLRELKQPEGDEKKIEAFLAPTETLVTAVGKAAGALRERKLIQVLGHVASARPLERDARRAAAAYGLHRCRAFVGVVP